MKGTAQFKKSDAAAHSVSDLPEIVSKAEFEQEFLTREDDFYYEWVNGTVIKNPRDMNQYQYYIRLNLQQYFDQLRQKNAVSGAFLVEVDTYLQPQVHRRPDMAWFSNPQLTQMAHRQNQVPEFVIEVISNNDEVDYLLDKLNDYAEANVKVVWLISPKLEQVHIYAGEKQTIAKGAMICSAAPALPLFEIAASDIFAKPELAQD